MKVNIDFALGYALTNIFMQLPPEIKVETEQKEIRTLQYIGICDKQFI